jgi:hypothetical protein
VRTTAPHRAGISRGPGTVCVVRFQRLGLVQVFRSSLRAVCVVACVCGVRLVRELGLYLYLIVIGLTKKSILLPLQER